MPGSLPVMSSALVSTLYLTLAAVPKNFGSANRTPPENAAWSNALKPCFSPTSRRAERASRSTVALFSRKSTLPVNRAFVRPRPGSPSASSDAALIVRATEPRSSAGSVSCTLSRAVSTVGVDAVGRQGDLDRAGRNLPHRLPAFAGNLNRRVAADERALQGLAVGRVVERHVLAVEPLEAPGSRGGAGNRRAAVQLERLHPLFVLASGAPCRCRR